MSPILNDAVKYIDQSRKAYLTIMDRIGKTFVINIAEFTNDCTDIYFIVDRNTRGVEDDSKVNVYFESKVKKYNIFKSICVFGKLTKIVYFTEIYRILKILKGSGRGSYIGNSSLKNYTVYKLRAEYVDLSNYNNPLGL